MRRHPHLIEISAWPWLERLSRDERRLVTLADVPGPRWDALAASGYDCVFLMGVWRRSAIGREIARTDPALMAEYDRLLPGWTDADVCGSPYCIQAYEPDDRMGGWNGLDAARRQLADRGMTLCLDFVPNHTAFDHAWIIEHPERYVLGTREDYERSPASFRSSTSRGETIFIACGRDPYFPPWTDVAQLNYFNVETREAVMAALRSIAADCDLVRCDMAMLLFNDVFDRTWRWLLRDRWPAPAAEFWMEATRAVPQLLYLAEVYWGLEERILDHGFSFAYDKRLLDAFHTPQAGRRAHELIAASTPDPSRLARFIENHDEPRSASALGSALPACASLVATSPGMRFFFDGQTDGRRIKVPVQLARWPDEPVDAAVCDLYGRLLGFATKPVLRDGAWRILDVWQIDGTSQNLQACRWRLNDQLAVVVVDLGAEPSQAHIDVAGELGVGVAFDFEDEMTANTYRWTRESLDQRGLWVRLNGGQAHLFSVHAVNQAMDERSTLDRAGI